MLKLPVCPYCGHSVGYDPAKKSMRVKQIKCIKCGKKMSVSYKKSAAKTAVWFVLFMVFVNTLFLFSANNKTLLPNLIFTVVFIFVYMAIVPLTVKYDKIDGEEDPPKKLKKNRHRHEKTKNRMTQFDDNPLKGTTFEK